MFILKLPKEYAQRPELEGPFKELSLSYKVVEGDIEQPMVQEGMKTHEGIQAIQRLIQELQNYYGQGYNCSCAR